MAQTGSPALQPSSFPPTNPSPAPTPPAQPEMVAPASTDTKPAITLGQAQPGPAPAAPRQTTDVTSLLSLGRDARVLPEDFKIGPLADQRVGDAEQQQALTTAGSFLSRLVAGKVDTGMIDPGTQSRVADMLNFGIQRGDVPRSYRIGTAKKHETGEVTASVRLFGPVGTSEGEISVARNGGHWVVTDLQISMDDLKVEREKPKERFFPSSYRWMLEE